MFFAVIILFTLSAAVLSGQSVSEADYAEQNSRKLSDSGDSAEAAERQQPVIDLPTYTFKAVRESVFGPVDGYKADRSASATRMDLAIDETPASIQVLTGKLFDDIGADRIEDALDYAAGVQETNSFGNTADGLLLRGFQANIAEDGVLSDGPFASITGRRDAAVVERVELVRGPNGALYGPGAPGGIINVVTKRPLDENFLEVRTQASTFERYRQSLDGNLVIDTEGRLKARVSGVFEDSDSFRDFVEGERFVVAPAMTFAPNEDLTFSYRGEFSRDETPFDRGIPIDEDGDRLAGEDDFFGDPSVGDIENEIARQQLEIEHRFAEDWRLRLLGSWTYNTLEGLAVEPVTLAPPPLDPNLLLRRNTRRDFTRELWTGRAEITGTFSTGPFEHKTLLSFEWRDLDSDRDFSTSSPLMTLPVDISDPDIDKPDDNPDQINDQLDEVENYGFIFFDRLRINHWLTLVGGGRFDTIEQASTTETIFFDVTSEFEESEFSPTIGAVVGPFKQVSFFTRYSESFVANTASGLDGEPLPPQKGEGIEGGLRFNSQDEALRITLTAFDIELDNVPVLNPISNLSRPSTQSGKGVELVVEGEITDALAVIAAYTYTDAEISNLAGLDGPSALQAVPEHEASVFFKYEFSGDFVEGLSARVGIRYTGERLNTVRRQINFTLLGEDLILGGSSLQSSVRIDLGLGYQIADRLDASFRVENVFDEEHERPSSPDIAQPGNPRTFSASLRYRF